MFRRLLNKKLFANKCLLSLKYLNRFLNLRIILSISCLIFLSLIVRFWVNNRISFGQHTYVLNKETILERRSSRFHNITVAQSDVLRMLRFDMLDVQGIIHREKQYLLLFDYMRLQLLCLLWKADPERILIIGLGAGILPRILHYLSPKTFIDIVEIDSEVNDLAQKYFKFKENDLVRVFIEDGRHYVDRQSLSRYDVIIIDAFTVTGHIPHSLRTLECLGEYLRILKSTGLILASFPYEQENRYRETYVRAFFKHLYRGVARKNYIFIGLHQEAKVFSSDQLRLRAGTLQHSKPLPDMNWIEEIKHLHSTNNDNKNRSGTIFTDEIYEDI